MKKSPEQIAGMRARAAARRAHRATLPSCTRLVTWRKVTKVCGARLDQNPVEQEDGTYWCPRCGRYTDGSMGFPVGHPARRDGPPKFGA